MSPKENTPWVRYTWYSSSARLADEISSGARGSTKAFCCCWHQHKRGSMGCGGMLHRTPRIEGAAERVMKLPTGVLLHYTLYSWTHTWMGEQWEKQTREKNQTFQTTPATPSPQEDSSCLLPPHLGSGLDRNAVDVLPAGRPSGALVLDEDVRSSHDHERAGHNKKKQMGKKTCLVRNSAMRRVCRLVWKDTRSESCGRCSCYCRSRHSGLLTQFAASCFLASFAANTLCCGLSPSCWCVCVC